MANELDADQNSYLAVIGESRITESAELGDVTFLDREQKEILKFRGTTGEILWRSRVVETDRELIDGLKELLIGKYHGAISDRLQVYIDGIPLRTEDGVVLELRERRVG